MVNFIQDLENIMLNKFVSIEELENYIFDYFKVKTKLNKCTENNHLTGVIEKYDIDIWYEIKNQNELYVTEVAWKENEKIEPTDLEFYSGLKTILDIYTGDDSWEEEPLDGDEVDNLIEILRKQLNLINGNITIKEYLKK